MNKKGLFDFVMVVCFVPRQNVKVIPPIMSSDFDVVSNGWGIVIFSEGLEVFSFPIMKPSFSFTNVKSTKIPAIYSPNNSGFLWTISAVLAAKERFYASSVLKNDLLVLTQVKTTGHNIKFGNLDIFARPKKTSRKRRPVVSRSAAFFHTYLYWSWIIAVISGLIPMKLGGKRPFFQIHCIQTSLIKDWNTFC